MTKPTTKYLAPACVGLWDTPYRIHKGHRLHWEPVKPYAAMTVRERDRRLGAIARTWHHKEA